MNDALGMRSLEPLCDFDCQREQSFVIERPARNQMFERDAVQELHDDERVAIVLADLVDGADIGMIERGRGARFAAKAFEGLLVSRQLVWQEFKGNEAAQFRILGFIDNAHAAATKLLDDPVMRNDLPNHAVGLC